jgi:decaprenylphospho-beta-D-ribofuranose 2-oxidase
MGNPASGGKRLPPAQAETFASFDGGVVVRAARLRPEHYREVEADLAGQPRIARGGGYSYAAASFLRDALVQDMRRFDRILAFDPEQLTVEVEAGLSVGDLLSFATTRGLWLPVVPGYPLITVGGCVAACVHGKNPRRHGTFLSHVLALTLFHPAYGLRRVSPEDLPEVFDLTCGGYGLTGIIETVTLQLTRLTGRFYRVERQPIHSLENAIDLLDEEADRAEYIYSFHDASPSATFGRGYVARASMTADDPPERPVRSPRTVMLDARRRAFSPVSVWGGWRTGLIQEIFWRWTASRAVSRMMPWFDVEFPFAGSPEYFLLYGRRGLVECQVIVPRDGARDMARELVAMVRRLRPDAVMCSLKYFRSEPALLRFSGDGACLTIDFARTPATLHFLPEFDALAVQLGAIPNLIKDSRLPRATVEATYPGCGEFRRRLAAYDPERLYRSELSERLGL